MKFDECYHDGAGIYKCDKCGHTEIQYRETDDCAKCADTKAIQQEPRVRRQKLQEQLKNVYIYRLEGEHQYHDWEGNQRVFKKITNPILMGDRIIDDNFKNLGYANEESILSSSKTIIGEEFEYSSDSHAEYFAVIYLNKEHTRGRGWVYGEFREFDLTIDINKKELTLANINPPVTSYRIRELWVDK
jgi:hypothetical protein